MNGSARWASVRACDVGRVDLIRQKSAARRSIDEYIARVLANIRHGVNTDRAADEAALMFSVASRLLPERSLYGDLHRMQPRDDHRDGLQR